MATEAPQMNDAAARSPTGEILDQMPPATPPAPDSTTTQNPENSTTPSPDSTSTATPEDGSAKPEAKKPEVPETYADFTAPEGYTLAKETIEAATPIFKELGLSQEQAQRLVTFHSEQMLAAAKAPQTTYENLRADWRAQVTSDAEIKSYALDGKTGLDAVKIDIGRALASLGDAKLSADFKAAMDLTGAGDNPAFIKTFWKIAQKIGEGKPVSGAAPSPLGQVDPSKGARPNGAKALYPNLP